MSRKLRFSGLLYREDAHEVERKALSQERAAAHVEYVAEKYSEEECAARLAEIHRDHPNLRGFDVEYEGEQNPGELS